MAPVIQGAYRQASPQQMPMPEQGQHSCGMSCKALIRSASKTRSRWFLQSFVLAQSTCRQAKLGSTL